MPTAKKVKQLIPAHQVRPGMEVKSHGRWVVVETVEVRITTGGGWRPHQPTEVVEVRT